MGVFEELLKRKVIKEDEDGNVSLTKRETRTVEKPNIQEQEDRISTYNGIKRMAMREEGETLRRASELRRIEEERNQQETQRRIGSYLLEPERSLPTASKRNTNYGLGNINLNNRPVVKNNDGTISTVRSMSFQDENGQEVLIPTVVNGKIVSDEEAIQHYYKTGEYLGKFNSIAEANNYAEKLHKEQEKQYSNSLLTANSKRDKEIQEQSYLIKNNLPVVSRDDPRLADAYKLSHGGFSNKTAEDYRKATALNTAIQEREAENINRMAKDNPVGAFAYNTLLSVAGGMGQTVAGLNNAANTVGLLGTKGIEKLGEITGNKELQDRAKRLYDQKVAEGEYINSIGSLQSGVNSRIDNNVIRTTGNVASTIGRQLLDSGLGTSAGITGAGIQGLGVAGSSSQEALNENPDNILGATVTGAAKGYLAKKIEDIFDANLLTKGGAKTSVQNEVTKWIAKTFKTKAGKNLAEYISGILGENAEEFIEDNADNIVDLVINGKDWPSLKEWLNNTSETAKMTTLSTAIMGLMGLGGNVQEYETEQYLNKSKENIRTQLNNSNALPVANKVSALNQLNNVNTLQDYNDYINNNADTLSVASQEYEAKQNQRINANTALEQQLINQQNNVAQNPTSQEIDITPVVNEQNRYENRRNTNELLEQLPAVNQENTYTNKLIESLRNNVTENDNLTTSAQKHNLKFDDISIESIQQVMDKADIKSRFDIADKFMNEDGTINENIGSYWSLTKNSDGTYTREIIFNPKASEKTIIQEMAVHEMFHDIFAKNTRISNDLYKSVKEYLEKDTEYINQKENLRNQYEGVYGDEVDQFITEEAIAKTLQTKFGTQEEINRLVNYNPSAARRFYDWIIDKLNKITGGNIERLYWEDVRNKFERAYSQEGNYKDSTFDNNNLTQYHISQNLSSDLDNVLKNLTAKEPVRLRDFTPSTFVQNGVQDLPMYENPSHIRKNILTEAEAMKLGLAINPRDHYHGLGKELYMKAIDSLDNPRVIFKRTQQNQNGNSEYFVLTMIKDNNNNNIVIPVEIETNTKIGKNIIDINRVETVYGYEKKNGIDLNDYIKHNLSNNKFEKIYEQKEDQGTGFSTATRSSINSIPSSNENVNTTKYSIQESENNSNNTQNVKDIKNLNEFIRKAKEIETDSYWKEQLKEASMANYVEWTRKESRLQWKRGLIQQYLDYKNNMFNNKMTKDNQGRMLSKEQQEYFKDIAPEFKDNNGNIKTYYTGTNADFTVFDSNKIAIDNLGRGFYFTDNKKIAQSYAERRTEERGGKPRIIEAYIKSQKPFDMGNVTREQAVSYLNYDFYDPDNLFVRNLRTKEQAKIEAEELVSDFEKEQQENWGEKRVKHAEDRGFIKNSSGYDYSMLISTSNASFQKWLRKENYDSILVPGKDKKSGIEGVAVVVFNPNQIKNVDNTNPTSNPDIRYSNNTNFDEYLENRVGKEGTRTSLGNLKVPTVNEKTSNVAPTADNNVAERARPGRSINYDVQSEQNNTIIDELPISDDRQKFRKHYDSIMKSQYTTDEARAIAKQLMKSDTYVPESNNKQLERADTRIKMSGADSELNSLMSRSMTGGNIKADDIAVGERLIQYYSKMGNKAKLQEAIQATAMAGTTAGQTVQAMSLLNHQTPEGQAVWLQRSVEKMNNDLKKRRGANADQFDLTPEMTEKIVNSKNAEELQNNLNEVYEELGQQASKSTIEKIDAWRYFSMLANPRTHIRNIVGNVAMGKVQTVKNKVAGVIEGTVSKFNSDMERTHTIAHASKVVKQFAQNDIANVADRLELNDNKYNPKTRLENSMRTFKHDAFENTLGKLFEFNNKALEVEDAWGLKAAYKKSLAEYMTANKLNPDTITDKQLAKARNYAVEQAKEATFHQASALATALNQFSNKNGVTKFISDSVVPFKKTPINVAKAGMEYSPVGLAKSAIYDTVQLRKGNISVNQYIDNVSKGLTGTGVALLGYALASAGILKASGTDDKDKEKYDEDRGKQTYSIQIGDNTYSLDWLAPTGIPLFIGAEVHEIMQQEKESKSSSSDEDSVYNQAVKSATNVLDAFTNAMNPMTEMSMLSGLTSALKSYDGDNSKMLANLGVNATKSYVNQFIPTALSQVAKTTDEYERSTTSMKSGTLPKAIDSTKNYAMSKIPGLRQMLPTKTDVWGNDLKQNDNVLLRGLENAVFPWTRKGISTNNVDRELETLYKNTGESSILPDSINKNLTIDKQKYIMTSAEYAKYKKQYGENAYKILNNLVSSNQYKKMSDSQKQKAIEKVYDYAKEQIKIDYAKNNKLTYDDSKLSKTVNSLKKSNANIANYFEYIASTQDMTKTSEKLGVLSNSSYSDKTKQIIYENNFVTDGDEKYPIIKSTGLNINTYIKYKLADSNGEFSSDKKDDGTEKGKTVSGSAKNKRYNYIINMQGATYMQKAILYGLSYSPEKKDKQTIVNYILNMEGKSSSEKKDMLKEFSWITFYKDGSFDI